MPFVRQNQSVVLKRGKETIEIQPLLGDRPAYIYDVDGILERLRWFSDSLPQGSGIHYAMKANSHPGILRQISTQGYGVDVVSGGEMRLALDSGFSPSKIVFSGVAKTVSELELAISKEVSQINVESPAELERVAEVAERIQRVARVAWRMNPDVNPVTHPYIRTGFRENKFGMDESFIPELMRIAERSPAIKVVGLTLHIGSQIRTLDSIFEAVDKVVPLYEELKARGLPLETFDVGGGLGIQYESPDPDEEKSRVVRYGEGLKARTQKLGARILCEPGRMVVAECGILVGEAQYIKQTPYKNFLILNTGMHHLMRPALYQAHHRIEPLTIYSDRQNVLYDVVGPICESADTLGHDRLLPEVRQGELVAIFDAGAYGRVMASQYNLHDFPDEILIKGGEVLK